MTTLTQSLAGDRLHALGDIPTSQSWLQPMYHQRVDHPNPGVNKRQQSPDFKFLLFSPEAKESICGDRVSNDRRDCEKG